MILPKQINKKKKEEKIHTCNLFVAHLLQCVYNKEQNKKKQKDKLTNVV